MGNRDKKFKVQMTKEALFDFMLHHSYSGLEKDLRAYPGVLRGTEEWENTYKIRTAVERDINHLKEHLCLAGRKTQNEKTLHADLILAARRHERTAPENPCMQQVSFLCVSCSPPLPS